METDNKIVAIGGGHGLGRVLAALKDFAGNATGIVTTTDNGGSTGRIRNCQGGIAWGDTRNCINQMITEPSLEAIMFEYRFHGQGELDGHNLGNLMLTALDNLSVRPLEVTHLICNMLRVKSHIIPMSEQPSDLCALDSEGNWVHGETGVDEMQQTLVRLALMPEVSATPEAIVAIEQADYIILGPGSFLTSIMPPLLIPEIGRAIAANSQAKLLFIDNLSPETGPVTKMDINSKLSWLADACGGRQVDVLIGQDKPHELAPQWDFYRTDLASENRRWRHDRDKLRTAILAQFSEMKTS